MIPAEAVEAAVIAFFASNDAGSDDIKDDMRAALEAAGPYMQELQWGVRDVSSLTIAGHPSEESARFAAAEHPEWYEVVSRPVSRWEVAR